LLEIDVRDVDDAIKEQVKERLMDISMDLINEIKEEAPVYSGQLKQSFQILQTKDDRIILGSRLNYAAHVQYGTRAHYPPIEPLKKWVRRKLNAEESAAYGVQQKIGQEGTDPNPYLTRAIDNVRRKYGG